MLIVGAFWENPREVVGCVAVIRTKDWPFKYRYYKTHGWLGTGWTDEDSWADVESGTETSRTANIWPVGKPFIVHVPLWLWCKLVSCLLKIVMYCNYSQKVLKRQLKLRGIVWKNISTMNCHLKALVLKTFKYIVVLIYSC